jgi:hypothetical protein
MSVASQTDDIWIPPGVGYSNTIRQSMSLLIEVTDPDSALTLWAESEIDMLPGTANPNFSVGDYIVHDTASFFGLDIVKLDFGGGVAPVPGDVQAGDARQGTTRLSRSVRR